MSHTSHAYAAIKTAHQTSAGLSFFLFFIRGLWHLRGCNRLESLWVRIVPHIVDTVLLVTAITLVIQSSQYPLVHTWLTAKVIALTVYIALGLYAFRFARQDKTRQFVAWLVALSVFGYIVAVAVTRNPQPF